MIWEPFILALVLGIIVSAGLYFAYLWPSVEPVDPDAAAPADPIAAPADPVAAPTDEEPVAPPAPTLPEPPTAGTETASPAP